ncbi:ribonuclease HI family protein [Desulfofundulus kuznetsovii]
MILQFLREVNGFLMEKLSKEKGLLRVYYGHFDGVSRGNPGEAAVGAYLVDENGEVVWEKSERVGVHTSNEAEYLALIALLEEVARRDIKEITVYGDSQLVINQVNGHWNINHAHLYELYRRADRLMRGRKVRLVWVPREKNMRADKLANQAFRNAGGV